MTLPQQNTASARPTSFYYLMCQLDRVQYPILLTALKSIQHLKNKKLTLKSQGWAHSALSQDTFPICGKNVYFLWHLQVF